jgi:hypothetical protein
MKGSMRQRALSWELRVYLGADPVSGKQRYATKTVRAGKREAQRVLNEMIVVRRCPRDSEHHRGLRDGDRQSLDSGQSTSFRFTCHT